MVPESFCPKALYLVPILEYLNIESPQFKIPQEKIADAVASKRCQLKLSIPRTGFARGKKRQSGHKRVRHTYIIV